MIYIEEIESQCYEILNRLKYNEIGIAIILLNKMIDYIRESKPSPISYK